MDFDIYLSYYVLNFSTPSSTTNIGERTNDSYPRARHWCLIVMSDTRPPRIIELSTPDGKQIKLRNAVTTIDHLPLPYLYHVANFTGEEEDFDHVIEHHPMRGGKYSAIYNNCQHFAATFLILLKALANGTHGRSFTQSPRYATTIKSVMSTDNTFLWNEPNLVLVTGPPGLLVAGVAAPFASLELPMAAGIMEVLGVTVAPWVLPVAGAGICCAGGVAGVYTVMGMYWKKHTKIKHPDVYGFPV